MVGETPQLHMSLIAQLRRAAGKHSLTDNESFDALWIAAQETKADEMLLARSLAEAMELPCERSLAAFAATLPSQQLQLHAVLLTVSILTRLWIRDRRAIDRMTVH